MNRSFHIIVVLVLLFSATQGFSQQEPASVHFFVKGFQTSGNNPLPEDRTQSVLQPFIGEHEGLEGLQAAIEALEDALRKAGFAFYRVSLVPKALDKGIVELQVSELAIDHVFVRGNKHFSSKNILLATPTLAKGKAPNTNVLSRAINMANTQPSKNIKLQFSESEEGGAIDAKLTVDDSDPDFFFTSLNNTGTEATGELRLTLGYQMTNLFDKDHNMSLSYTLSPNETDAVNLYGLSYSIPFYESGSRFDLLISHSDVDSGVVSQQFEVSGRGTVVSLNYNKIFLQNGSYKQEMDIGFAHKKFENNVTLLGSIAQADDIISQPLSITYKGANASTESNLNFSLGLSANISGGSQNEEADYQANRSVSDLAGNLIAAASADWSKINYSFNYISFLSTDWLLRFSLMGQETSDMLISGEQFGIGGMSSVRGFEERAILGDKGYQANLELWMPSFTEQKIRPLVFYDIGHTEIINPTLGTMAEEDPSSVGLGLRWSSRENLSASLDYGHVLNAAGLIQKGENRVHLNVYYRF